MKRRQAAVEGRFYPSTKSKILAQIEEIDNEARYESESFEINHILGAVLPHAGHLYSGHQTVPFFKLLRQHEIYPDTFVIVHPNHRGMGAPIAVDDSNVWVNAIGEVNTNREFARAMELPFDNRAHAGEHSAEVIIPFIQYYFPDHPFSIVAVCMRDQGQKAAKLVAERIEKAGKESGQHVMVVSSCDFSHFISPEIGVERDQYVVNEIISRSSAGVERALREHNLSICGFGPIMALMEYALSVDAHYKTKILARGHSGEVFRSNEVVDYISMVLYQ